MRLRLALPFLLLAACTTVRPTPVDPAAARESLLSADRALAVAGSVQGGLDEDAAVLVPNQNVARGSAARAALTQSLNGARLRWRPAYAEVSRDAMRGYTMGYAELEGAGADTARRHVQYVAYWRRAPGSPWKILAYVRNPSPPPPSSIVLPPTPVPGPGAPGDPAPSAELVMSADRAFAKNGAEQGARAAFVRWVADDAVAFSPKGFDFGAAVREGYGRAFQGDPQFQWGPVLGDISPSGDLGFTVGEARITIAGANGGLPRLNYSKYLTIWKRQPDGTYRFVVDMGNPRPAR